MEHLRALWERIREDIRRNPGLWIGVGVSAAVLVVAYLAYRKSGASNSAQVPANGYGFPDYGSATGGSSSGGLFGGYSPYQPVSPAVPSTPVAPVTYVPTAAPSSPPGVPSLSSFPPFTLTPAAPAASVPAYQLPKPFAASFPRHIVERSAPAPKAAAHRTLGHLTERSAPARHPATHPTAHAVSVPHVNYTTAYPSAVRGTLS